MFLSELFADDLLFYEELANKIGEHWSTVALNMNVAPTMITSCLHLRTPLGEVVLTFLRYLADDFRSVSELTDALTKSGLSRLAISLAEMERAAQIPPFASCPPLPHSTWMERARNKSNLVDATANGNKHQDLATEIASRWHVLALALDIDPLSVKSATEQPHTSYNLARRLLGVLRGRSAEEMEGGLRRANMAGLIPRFRTMAGWWENAQEAINPAEKRRRTENGPDRAAGNECIICLERERTVAFSPCNHLAVCEECAKTIGECPFCRQPIENRVYLFVP